MVQLCKEILLKIFQKKYIHVINYKPRTALLSGSVFAINSDCFYRTCITYPGYESIYPNRCISLKVSTDLGEQDQDIISATDNFEGNYIKKR